MQSGYIEGLDGKFRSECLNKYWFQTLQQARETIAHPWRDDGCAKPHSGRGQTPPLRASPGSRVKITKKARNSGPSNVNTSLRAKSGCLSPDELPRADAPSPRQAALDLPAPACQAPESRAAPWRS
ncbi:integrase core domain-containing protein [Calidifontimicrobium sp. SYSU G02091]|uniref:integrase core domain-containing protein n=1 Tax=Calidifontimicrobium sp. SYSU G02091 TaxID=2926421 RepID=UPI003FA4CF12